MDLGRWSPPRGLARNCVGALLMLAGVGLMAMTARGVLNYRAAASRHGGEVVDLDADAGLQAGQRGFMARVVGTPVVVEPPNDPDFNLRVNTPVLVRNVEMFQWREVRIGDEVHYEQDWVGRPIDASHFEHPATPIRARSPLAANSSTPGWCGLADSTCRRRCCMHCPVPPRRHPT